MTAHHLPQLPGKIIAMDVALYTIELNDGQKISWPRQKTDTLNTGDQIFVILATEENQDILAKKLLNQILKPGNSAHDSTS